MQPSASLHTLLMNVEASRIPPAITNIAPRVSRPGIQTSDEISLRSYCSIANADYLQIPNGAKLTCFPVYGLRSQKVEWRLQGSAQTSMFSCCGIS